MYEIKMMEAVMNNESSKKSNSKKVEVRISEKVLLTLEEAAAYTGIGINKLRILTDTDYANCVLWNGSKRLLKREKLKDYLLKEFSI